MTSAAALANRKAEPMPCRMRHRISTVASEEKPAPSEASANTRKPPDVGALAPEQVAQPARHQHEHGGGDQVGEDHPHERQQARVQRALEIGQRDDQRARVGRREQHPEARARERPPLVVLVAGGDAEAGSSRRVLARLCDWRGGQVDVLPRAIAEIDVNVKITIAGRVGWIRIPRGGARTDRDE